MPKSSATQQVQAKGGYICNWLVISLSSVSSGRLRRVTVYSSCHRQFSQTKITSKTRFLIAFESNIWYSPVIQAIAFPRGGDVPMVLVIGFFFSPHCVILAQVFYL